MSSSTWREHFKDRLAGLQTPEMGSELAHALREGLIDEDEYLDWASRATLMPVLGRSFFSEQTPAPQLLGKISYTWSEECFPVSEWDGLLIVACLEKPASFPTEHPAIFILAPLKEMCEWWPKMQEGAESGEQAEPGGMPEGFAMPAENTPSAPKLDFSNLSVVQSPPTEPTPTAEPPAAAAQAKSPADEDTILRPAPSTAAKSSPSILKPTAPAAGPAATDQGKPAPSVTTPAAPVAPTPAATPKVSLKPTAPAATSAAAAAPTASVTASATATASKPVASKPAVADANSPLNDDYTVTRAISSGAESPPQPMPVKTTVAPPLTTEKNTLASLLNSKPEVRPAAERVLSYMRPHFDKVMMLSLTDKKDAFYPALWNETFVGIVNIQKIPLHSASLFKIVQITEKPYHGYVVASPANESFFTTWTSGEMPAHVTCVPIFFQGVLYGAFLGIGATTAYTLPTLRLCEKLSAEFTKTIGGATPSEVTAA